MDPSSPEPILTPGLDGFRLWLGDEVLSQHRTEAEARKAYRAALELAAKAKTQLTRTLERTV